MENDKAYYVYKLIDPRNKHTFYVGKGKGDRYHAHIKDALKNYNGVDYTGKDSDGKVEDDVSTKMAVIREIHDQGLEVEVLIIRHGLDEQTAYEVEAALIDTTPGLVNIVRGHSTDRGVINVNIGGKEAHNSFRNDKKTKPAHRTQKADTNSLRKQLIEKIRHSGYISIDNKITFHKSVDVLNDLFDKGYNGWQRAVCPIKNLCDIWFPKLDTINKKGEQCTTNKHWHNYFIENQKYIVEYPTSKNGLITLDWPPKKLDKSEPYVFAKYEGSYQFFGIYETDRIATAGELGLTLEIEPNDPVVVFKRLDTKAKLPLI